MSQPRFPDPARSRALLIGATRFTAAGPDLPDIPSVQANLTDLRKVLTSPDTGVLRPEVCRVLTDPSSVDEVGSVLTDMAATATDVLLVYYAGHGLVDDRGRLHLALAHTHPRRARWTALPVDLLREEIANSIAPTRVLVLDCCFSGRAIEAMADDEGAAGGQLDVAGTYTLTSTSANAPSHAPAGDRYTAFTGALLHALHQADPLTLDQIYVAVDRDLAAQNLPRPQRRAVNTAGDLALSSGPTTGAHIEPTDLDEVHFRGEHPARRVLLQIFKGLSRVALILISCYLIPAIFLWILTIILPATESALIIIILLFGVFYVLANPASRRRLVSLLGRHALYIFRGFIPGAQETRAQKLTVNRSGLTVQGVRMSIHLPWTDIIQVGVLQPQYGSPNQRRITAQHERKEVLAVRLRTDLPVPGIVSILSERHRQLGYLGLCTLEDIQASYLEIVSALKLFAGSKLHSPRQFLDRDPRLQSDMV